MNKHDLFFYGTVCHVCKVRGRLKRCSACKMIAYCSATHQKEHWHSHKRICKHIQRFLVAETGNTTRYPHRKRESWTELMMFVEFNSERELLPFERQMFWFARKCEVCYEYEHDKLEDCESCASASYCTDKNCRTLDSKHATCCSDLNLSFELDKYLMHNNYPPFLLPQFSRALIAGSMETFVGNVISGSDCKGTDLAIPLYAEVFSCPLTLVYSIEKLQMTERKRIVAHIVGAANAECSFIAYWETVLHCLTELKHLLIVFIGPECWDQETKLQLCADCREKGNSLNIAVCANLYHEYISSPQHLQPDVVVAFNCGLHQTQGSANDTWAASIPLLARQSPLVLTSYTPQEAEQDIGRMDPDLERVADCEVNPYRSLRPHRDTDTTVFYLNTILSIVQKQCSS